MAVSIDGDGGITGIATVNVSGGIEVGTGATINGSTNTIIASTNGSERLRVTSAGQVSLLNGGSQYGFLKESGSGNTELGGTTDLKLSTDGTERVRVTSSGKVGINTTGPNATLTVGPVDTPGFNRGSVAIKALTDGNSLPTNIYLEEESGAEGYQLSIDSNGDLNFHNSGAAAPTVTFSDDDKVGIGTDNPAVKLDIVDSVSPNIALRGSSYPSIRYSALDGTTDAEIYYGIGGDDLVLNNVNAGPISLKTSNTERLRISSAGQVTKPYNAAFRAQGNTQYANQTSSLDLVYDNEIFDAGSNYDPSTGRFTAPVDGKYFFYFQYLTYPDADPVYKTMNFKVNGTSSYNNGFFRTRSVTQESSALTALLDLSANDWVIPYVVWASGTYDFYMINGHAHFFGYLVS